MKWHKSHCYVVLKRKILYNQIALWNCDMNFKTWQIHAIFLLGLCDRNNDLFVAYFWFGNHLPYYNPHYLTSRRRNQNVYLPTFTICI